MKYERPAEEFERRWGFKDLSQVYTIPDFPADADDVNKPAIYFADSNMVKRAARLEGHADSLKGEASKCEYWERHYNEHGRYPDNAPSYTRDWTAVEARRNADWHKAKLKNIAIRLIESNPALAGVDLNLDSIEENFTFVRGVTSGFLPRDIDDFIKRQRIAVSLNNGFIPGSYDPIWHRPEANPNQHQREQLERGVGVIPWHPSKETLDSIKVQYDERKHNRLITFLRSFSHGPW